MQIIEGFKAWAVSWNCAGQAKHYVASSELSKSHMNVIYQLSSLDSNHSWRWYGE